MESETERESRLPKPGESDPDRRAAAPAQPNGSDGAAPSGSGEAPQQNMVRGDISVMTGDNHVRTLATIEAEVIRLAIGHYRGQMTEVARRLGIGRSTLYRKLSDLRIDSRH